jgi:hypothetical protein
MPLMTVPGDDIVYGKSYAPGWRWRKDDCEFNGRRVIAGSDRTNSLMEPVASVEILRRTVEFGHMNVWIGYSEHPARRSTLVQIPHLSRRSCPGARPPRQVRRATTGPWVRAV